MAEKIIGVYKITNTITGDFYIGSSKNIKSRWANHKCPSTWKKCPNNPMYIDIQKYGKDKFVFEVLEVVEADSLKEKEQKFIETLNPSYNNRNANGLDIERHKESQKEYKKTEKYKESHKKSQKEYQKTEKGKESQKKARNKYYNQLCFYNDQTLTLRALYMRFLRQGIINPTQEAKKYLLKKESKTPIEFYDVYP